MHWNPRSGTVKVLKMRDFFRIDHYYTFKVCRDEMNEISDGGNILLSALI